MVFALIIIDQQKGIDHPKLGARNNREAENTILFLLEKWRKNGWPIIHVRHRSKEPESVFWPEQSGYEFKEAFLPLPNEITITKSTPCAFTHTTLIDELKKLQVNNIVMVGVATNNSIEASARTAGNLGYVVNVVEKACFTFAKKDFFGQARSAQDVHAMSLANLHGEYATVVSIPELQKKMSAEADKSN